MFCFRLRANGRPSASSRRTRQARLIQPISSVPHPSRVRLARAVPCSRRLPRATHKFFMPCWSTSMKDRPRLFSACGPCTSLERPTAPPAPMLFHDRSRSSRDRFSRNAAAKWFVKLRVSPVRTSRSCFRVVLPERLRIRTPTPSLPRALSDRSRVCRVMLRWVEVEDRSEWGLTGRARANPSAWHVSMPRKLLPSSRVSSGTRWRSSWLTSMAQGRSSVMLLLRSRCVSCCAACVTQTRLETPSGPRAMLVNFHLGRFSCSRTCGVGGMPSSSQVRTYMSPGVSPARGLRGSSHCCPCRRPCFFLTDGVHSSTFSMMLPGVTLLVGLSSRSSPSSSPRVTCEISSTMESCAWRVGRRSRCSCSRNCWTTDLRRSRAPRFRAELSGMDDESDSRSLWPAMSSPISFARCRIPAMYSFDTHFMTCGRFHSSSLRRSSSSEIFRLTRWRASFATSSSNE